MLLWDRMLIKFVGTPLNQKIRAEIFRQGPLKSTYEAGKEGNKKMSAIKPVIMNMHLLVKTKIFLVMDLFIFIVLYIFNIRNVKNSDIL